MVATRDQEAGTRGSGSGGGAGCAPRNGRRAPAGLGVMRRRSNGPTGLRALRPAHPAVGGRGAQQPSAACHSSLHGNTKHQRTRWPSNPHPWPEPAARGRGAPAAPTRVVATSWLLTRRPIALPIAAWGLGAAGMPAVACCAAGVAPCRPPCCSQRLRALELKL